MQQDKSNSHHRESQAGQGNGQGYAHGQGQAMQAQDHRVARASVTSSVNGLIQQSFQWLDVDGMDDGKAGCSSLFCLSVSSLTPLSTCRQRRSIPSTRTAQSSIQERQSISDEQQEQHPFKN